MSQVIHMLAINRKHTDSLTQASSLQAVCCACSLVEVVVGGHVVDVLGGLVVVRDHSVDFVADGTIVSIRGELNVGLFLVREVGCVREVVGGTSVVSGVVVDNMGELLAVMASHSLDEVFRLRVEGRVRVVVFMRVIVVNTCGVVSERSLHVGDASVVAVALGVVAMAVGT